ncbi:MAG: sugar phosphate isomerase/epimerase [Planctomycetales bacterium]|nr:sugar phosphate isomerase/epimerase [Planctomycetales bacterium]
MSLNRRQFVAASSAALTATLSASALPGTLRAAEEAAEMRLGLVTYLWGKDMDLPTLLKVCEQSGVLGLELRTEHAHKVEPNLSKAERAEVRKRFADSPVTLVGYGSNAQYHEQDPAKVKANIELTKKYIHLMHDCGGSGVKVKPNALLKDVPTEKTVEQIGKALNEVAAYGAEHGQEIRVEAHGRGTSDLPIMKAIFDVADHRNVGVCWNSNDVDVTGQGLEYNFNLVKNRLATTTHVRELNLGDYPYPKLIELLVSTKYNGWVLLECRTNPADKVAAMIEQAKVFDELIAKAKRG